MKAVVYYRSRPSEPDASEIAMRLQREAVRQMVLRDEMTVVAEFVEQEGEPGSDAYPAYHAAVRASATGGVDTFVVVSRAAIGSGAWSSPPWMEMPPFVMEFSMREPLVEIAATIPLPVGAPPGISLYAVNQPSQGITAIYLCNPGAEAMDGVTVITNLYAMGIDAGKRPGQPLKPVDGPFEEKLGPIPSNCCILVNTLSHEDWDEYYHYRVSFMIDGLPHSPIVANDGPLNAAWLAERPVEVWVEFKAAQT